jgi:hypothetical protein
MLSGLFAAILNAICFMNHQLKQVVTEYNVA